jgi:hypothetical protein
MTPVTPRPDRPAAWWKLVTRLQQAADDHIRQLVGDLMLDDALDDVGFTAG